MLDVAADGVDARHRREARDQTRSKNSAARAPGYAVRGSATSIVSTPSALEAGVDVQQPDERLNQERRADQQHRGERDFDDDEHVAGAMRAAAADGAAAAFAQALDEIDARGLQRRHDAEDDAGQRPR